jgi:Ion channel
MSLMCLATVIILYENELADPGQEFLSNELIVYLKLSYNIFNGIGLSLLVLHQFLSPSPYRKSKKSLLINVVTFLIVPYLNTDITVCDPIPYTVACYSITELIIMLMFFRVFFFIGALVQFSIFYSLYDPEIFTEFSPIVFTLKCLYSKQRGRCALGLFLLIIALFAYLFKIMESTENSRNEYESYMESLWYSFNTGITLGMGGIYPKSTLGRFCSISLIVMGGTISCYFFLSVGGNCTLGYTEFIVYKDINIADKAAKLIKSFLVLKKSEFNSEKAKKAFNRCLDDFKKERKRQYVSPFDFRRATYEMNEIPPKDYRCIGKHVAILERNLEEITELILKLIEN